MWVVRQVNITDLGIRAMSEVQVEIRVMSEVQVDTFNYWCIIHQSLLLGTALIILLGMALWPERHA